MDIDEQESIKKRLHDIGVLLKNWEKEEISFDHQLTTLITGICIIISCANLPENMNNSFIDGFFDKSHAELTKIIVKKMRESNRENQ